MTDPEEEAVVRDKRRLDPETGQVRSEDATAQAAAGEQIFDGAAAQARTSGAGQAEGDAASSEDDPVVAAKAEAADLQDQLARAKADLYNLDQRFNAFVKRSRTEAQVERGRGVEDVIEALVPVLDEVHHARENDGLEGPLGAVVEKLEDTLSTRYSVERYGSAGEEFDPNVHEALMHQASDEVATETVSQVLQPGYRVGEKVVRPARVAVTGPQ